MKYFYLIVILCLVFVIHGLVIDTPKDQNTIKPLKYLNELEGIWKVDYAFNQNNWEINAVKGISHQWYEVIILKEDTFYLEDHEWWPPRKSSNSTEYFPFEGKEFIKGTYKIKDDTLLFDGYYTDYLYSDNYSNPTGYKKTFTFKVNGDTLNLLQNAVIKDRLIRKNN